MNKLERIKIYEEIQKEMEIELREHLPISEIHSIVESQFKIMLYAFSKGVGVHLPFIGKFFPFDMDFFAERVIIPNKQLQEELIIQEEEDEAKLAFIDSIKSYKKAIHTTANDTATSAFELINIPNMDGSTDNLNIFKNFRK